MEKRRRRSRPTGLAGVSIDVLHAEIERRRQKSGSLHRVRDRLLSRLAKIEARIVAAGGELAHAVREWRGPRARAQNALSLAGALQKVLKNRTLSVAEAAAEVRRLGYKTTSKTFRTIVNQTLIKHTDKFKKVARGRYTAT